MSFKVGDSIQVREGIMCPDDDSVCMSHWQGRVFEVEDDNIIGIRWDSMTLKQLPCEYIKKAEEEGLGWAEMYLGADEIEPASPRDSKEEADETADRMESKFQWFGTDQEGERILKVIGDADNEIEAWHQHLSQVVNFPFDAEVSEPQDKGPLGYGDKVKVHRMTDTDDLYGILVDVTFGKERFVFPLCDLTVRDRKSSNYLPVNDYCVWFANT